jgi:hypothetical protein
MSRNQPETTTTSGLPTEVSLVDGFVDFAKDADDENFSRLPLAESVMLGLGPEVVSSVKSSELRNPDAWLLELEEFRAYEGPFSALRLLESLDGYNVSVGEHAHCASPPMPPPDRLEDHTRVSVHPRLGSDASCLMWYSVDFFIDSNGMVRSGNYGPMGTMIGGLIP